jgi:hypothetical protein
MRQIGNPEINNGGGSGVRLACFSDPILLAAGLTCKFRMGFQGHESQRICERVHPFLLYLFTGHSSDHP